MSYIEAADFNYVLCNDSWYNMMQWRPLTVTACRTTWGSWWFNLLTMAFRHSLAPFLCCCTWSQRSIICPQSSAVFFASVTFSMVWGKNIVKMSNDKFGWVFSCFSHKTYLWSGQRDLGWRRSPFWILTHLFTRIFVQQREKLELFAIQYMTCHEQGTFFLCFTYGSVFI